MWSLSLRIAGTLIVLWLAARSLLSLPEGIVWEDAINAVRPLPCAIFVILFVVATYLRALRFGRIIRLSVAIPWRRIILHYPWLFMIGAITPFRAGDIWRAVWITLHTKNAKKALPSAVACLVVERLLDVVALICLGSLGLLLTPEWESGNSLEVNHLAAILIALAILVSGFVLFWPTQLESLLRLLPLSQNSRFRNFAEELIRGVVLIRQRGELGPAVALTVTIWMLLVLAFNYFLGSLVPGLSFGAASLTIAAVNFVNLISAVPANIGTYQAASMAALQAFGTSASTGLMAGVVLQTLNLLTVLILGFSSRAIAAASCDRSLKR